MFLLPSRGRDPENKECDSRGNNGFEDPARCDSRDPHHRRGGIAEDAPRAASVRRRRDRGDKSDVYLAAEKLMRHRTADKGAGDIVEKARENPNQAEQGKSALPVSRKKFGQTHRQLAGLKVACEQGEAHQQKKQIT